MCFTLIIHLGCQGILFISIIVCWLDGSTIIPSSHHLILICISQLILLSQYYLLCLLTTGSILRQDCISRLLMLALLLHSILFWIILPLVIQFKSLFRTTTNLLLSLRIKLLLLCLSCHVTWRYRINTNLIWVILPCV